MSTSKTDLLPLETEGLVVESSNDGFKLMPVTLDDMRSDEVLVEMKYSGICHTVSYGSVGLCTVDSPPFHLPWPLQFYLTWRRPNACCRTLSAQLAAMTTFWTFLLRWDTKELGLSAPSGPT